VPSPVDFIALRSTTLPNKVQYVNKDSLRNLAKLRLKHQLSACPPAQQLYTPHHHTMLKNIENLEDFPTKSKDILYMISAQHSKRSSRVIHG